MWAARPVYSDSVLNKTNWLPDMGKPYHQSCCAPFAHQHLSGFLPLQAPHRQMHPRPMMRMHGSGSFLQGLPKVDKEGRCLLQCAIALGIHRSCYLHVILP